MAWRDPHAHAAHRFPHSQPATRRPGTTRPSKRIGRAAAHWPQLQIVGGFSAHVAVIAGPDSAGAAKQPRCSSAAAEPCSPSAAATSPTSEVTNNRPILGTFAGDRQVSRSVSRHPVPGRRSYGRLADLRAVHGRRRAAHPVAQAFARYAQAGAQRLLAGKGLLVGEAGSTSGQRAAAPGLTRQRQSAASRASRRAGDHRRAVPARAGRLVRRGDRGRGRPGSPAKDHQDQTLDADTRIIELLAEHAAQS